MTTKMLDAGVKNAGLDGVFEHVLGTDQIRAYKPDPRAYQMAIDAVDLKREEMLFVAFAGCDAAGANVGAAMISGACNDEWTIPVCILHAPV